MSDETVFLSAILETLNCIKKASVSIVSKLGRIEEFLIMNDRNKRYIQQLGQFITVPANGIIMTSSADGDTSKFSKCRIEVQAGFTNDNGAGLEIFLMWGNAEIGKIIDIGINNGATRARSDVINIQELPGFFVKIHNKDVDTITVLDFINVIYFNEG